MVAIFPACVGCSTFTNTDDAILVIQNTTAADEPFTDEYRPVDALDTIPAGISPFTIWQLFVLKPNSEVITPENVRSSILLSR